MKIHFIAIGGSAMHNLAIALKRSGYKVSGSDDEIFEPSKSRLLKEGILPTESGWFPKKITSDLKAVILGMHARADNPELIEAQRLNIPVFSYPEYIYEQTKNQKRIVIGGSHGKTSITSMVLHVAKMLNININYMVGAQLEGYDCMVKLNKEAKFAILEGDEYLSSPIDRRPKFHLYQPNVGFISGIAWDHINVFPTFENYVEQFDIFCSKISPDGCLIYNSEDAAVNALGHKWKGKIKTKPYQTPSYAIRDDKTCLHYLNKTYPLQIFGAHNLQNLMGAMAICQEMEIAATDFLEAMVSFTGAGKRLQKVAESKNFVMFKDFAHSPSKLKATTAAVKEQFPNRKLYAYMELHTFSSLNKTFLPHYKNTMQKADVAVVYFNPEVVQHKKLPALSVEEVQEGFGGNVLVFDNAQKLKAHLYKQNIKNSALLMMSSGNFDGLNFELIGEELSKKIKE
jgi:UDP-N-acetylmuramate: L-alanyl-gamma-D-glutamyl-meso-diaminopimelate ligase